MKKRIGSLLLAVLLVVSLVTCAAAAEPAVLSGLRLSATRLLGQTSVQVFLTEEGATNGRIEVTYDAEKLELVSVKAANESWFTSVNSEEEGLVSFAWAASDLGAEETRMFRLVFRELGSKKDSLVIGGEVTELYDSGKVLETKPSKVSIEVKEDNVSDVIIGGITSGAAGGHPFVDIDGHWAEEEIAQAYADGLVNGTNADHFSPDAAVTRGMFVTFLYRLSGEPSSHVELPFVDVPNGQYYTEAVRWAYDNQVVKGTNADHFSPDALVTRQEMVAMLYRYAQYDGRNTRARDTLTEFSDKATVASWAKEAMEWAVAEGVINGAHGKLNPMSNATRAEAAAILVRFAGM